MSGVKLTYDDYVHFPDDGLRHELIDGEHYVTPTPIRKHQAIATNLVGSIWNYLREYPVGRVFTAPFGVFLTTERLGQIATSPWVKGPPSLELDTIDVYRRIEGRFQRTAQLSLEAGDVLATDLLPA